jgi:hypothetical protein
MFTNSVNGIRDSMELMNKAAYEASRGVDGDLVQAQVDAIEAQAELGANLAMLKAANQMQKSIIDILA